MTSVRVAACSFLAIAFVGACGGSAVVEESDGGGGGGASQGGNAVTGGTGAGSTSTGTSTGGAGGAGTLALTDGEVCQCLLGIGVDYETNQTRGTPAYECASCFKTVFGDSCPELETACIDDSQCSAVFSCMTNSEYEPSALEGCLAPIAGTPSEGLFFDLMGCACLDCQSACQYDGPPTCAP